MASLSPPPSGLGGSPSASARPSRTTSGHGQGRLGEPRQPRSTPGACSTRASATAARSAPPACATGRSTACTSAPSASTCSAQHHGRARPCELLRDVARCAASGSERELRDLGRLPYPMVRRRGEPGFRRVSWDEALDLDRRRASAPPRRIASRFYMTSRGITNEVYYVAQKVARFLGTNNVDNAARLCHSPSTVALEADASASAPPPAPTRTGSAPTSSSSSAATSPTTSR